MNVLDLLKLIEKNYQTWKTHTAEVAHVIIASSATTNQVAADWALNATFAQNTDPIRDYGKIHLGKPSKQKKF